VFVAMLIIDIVMSFFLLKDSYPEFESMSKVELLIIGVLVAPIMETAIYQVFIIKVSRHIFSKFLNSDYTIPILLSAICFGLSHPYDVYYEIMAFMSGIILAFAYCILLLRKESSFWIVALIHSLVNLTAIIGM